METADSFFLYCLNKLICSISELCALYSTQIEAVLESQQDCLKSHWKSILLHALQNGRKTEFKCRNPFRSIAVLDNFFSHLPQSSLPTANFTTLRH